MTRLLYLLGFVALAASNKTTIQLGCLLTDDPFSSSGFWLTAPYEAMQFAISEINADPNMLPNFNLKLVCNYSYYSTENAANNGIWHVTHGSVALLGIPYSFEAIPLSYIASYSSVPLISISATAASLNNHDYFPSFQRLIPSDTSYTGILLSLCQHYGWSNLVIVYSTDDYGRSFLQDMSAIEQDIVTLTFFPTPYTADEEAMAIFLQTGHQIKELDTRIVFMMTTPVVETMEAFNTIPGLLNSDFVFILNQDAIIYNATEIQSFYGGVLQLVVSDVSNAKTDQLATLPNYTDTEVSYVQYSYDSVYVVATALETLINEQGVNQTIPSTAALTAQIRNISLEGASGLIRFCGSDRLPLNWTIYSMPIGGPAFRPVLVASTDPVCHPQGSYSKYSIEPFLGSTIVWANGLTTVPTDKQHAQVTGLREGTIGACTTLILVGIVTIFLGFILTNINARTRVIKGSSVLFCNLILLGILIALLALLIETNYNRADAYACMLVPGLLALSFDITFGSLFAKTWRLHKIFQNAKHLKRSVITNAQVFLPVFVLISFDACVMSIWAGIDLPGVSLEADPIRAYTLVQRCGMKFRTLWFSLLILPKLGVLIYGMLISYQVRNIDKTFRESKNIAAAIIALFLCGAVTTPVLLLVWEQIDAAQVLLTIGVTLSLMSVALVLFVPKFWKIYTGTHETELASSTALDASGTSHSWKPDHGPSRGGGSTVEEGTTLKTFESANGRNSPTTEMNNVKPYESANGRNSPTPAEPTIFNPFSASLIPKEEGSRVEESSPRSVEVMIVTTPPAQAGDTEVYVS